MLGKDYTFTFKEISDRKRKNSGYERLQDPKISALNLLPEAV